MTAQISTTYILVFRTNIRSREDLPLIGRVLAPLAEISRWNVDFQDVDKVLRIESSCALQQNVITALKNVGFQCSELED